MTRPEGYQVYDFDYEILRELPGEDESVGKVIPVAVQVHTLMRGRLGKGGFNSGTLGARLRILKAMGLVNGLEIPPTSKGAGWQRTKKGTALLNGRGGKEKK